jgi:hypothetical protein
MEKLINQILTHKNLFHPSTTITSEHLKNNYLKNHLISINNIENLKQNLNQLNNINN